DSQSAGGTASGFVQGRRSRLREFSVAERIAALEDWAARNTDRHGHFPGLGQRWPLPGSAGEAVNIGLWLFQLEGRGVPAAHAADAADIEIALMRTGYQPVRDDATGWIEAFEGSSYAANRMPWHQTLSLIAAMWEWIDEYPEHHGTIPPEDYVWNVGYKKVPLGKALHEMAAGLADFSDNRDLQAMTEEALRARGYLVLHDGPGWFHAPNGVLGADSVQDAAPGTSEVIDLSADMHEAEPSATGVVPGPWMDLRAGPVTVPPGRGVQVDPSGRVYWVDASPSTTMRQMLLAAVADFDAEVIFLGAPLAGKASDQAIRDVRCLAQHLALGQRPHVVVTPAYLHETLTELSEDLTVSIIHPTLPQRSPGKASLGYDWTATLGTTAVTLGPVLTRAGLTTATRHTKTHPRITPALAHLLLATDRDTTLTILHTHRDELTSPQARTDLNTILTRVQNDPWFTRFNPLLGELGTPHAAPIVLDYQQDPDPTTRNYHLITDHARSITPTLRVDLIKQTGHPATGATYALEAVNIFFSAGIEVAKAYVHEHSKQLANNEKINWVNAITKLARDPDHIQDNPELHNLATAVLDCT
ncbi:hypothetical protein ACLQ24_26460, partial [Micromonospora sp. DT4]|uniref:hypothetical protein n=1 Tax=Micromonospora sp. DT4 TaxID=3393438 RepID=UPI003CF53A2E